MTEPTRPVLRWHGGKWRLAPWILSFFPKHRVYVEAFGGGGSVLVRKERSYAEIYNDLDDEAVCFFKVLRDRVKGTELYERLKLTPFARTELVEAYADPIDEIDRARKLVVRSFMGFGSDAHNPRNKQAFRANSNRSGSTPAHDWVTYAEALPAAINRLQGVVVENRPATTVMAQHDSADTLHYVDPPYIHETRSSAHAYAFEMTDEDHGDLLQYLKTVDGMVVLSGYPHPLYEEALSDWRRTERKALADGARERTEVLWINPLCAERLDAEKLPLLSGAA